MSLVDRVMTHPLSLSPAGFSLQWPENVNRVWMPRCSSERIMLSSPLRYLLAMNHMLTKRGDHRNLNNKTIALLLRFMWRRQSTRSGFDLWFNPWPLARMRVMVMRVPCLRDSAHSDDNKEGGVYFQSLLCRCFPKNVCTCVRLKLSTQERLSSNLS